MYIPAKRTPVTSLQMLDAMSKAAPELSRASLLVLLAHWALETGKGASMWNFNIGNAKTTPGGQGHHTFLPFCDEYLKPAHAAALVAKAKPRTDGKPGMDAVLGGKKQSDGDVQVLFYPSNPADCFRAFHTLDDGVVDHMLLLRRRFHAAWPFVEAADVLGFCRKLGALGYFTAAVEPYARAVADWVTRLDHETYVLAALPKAGFASIADAQVALGMEPTGVANEALRVELAIRTGDVNP
jgi:hypothetical protein